MSICRKRAPQRYGEWSTTPTRPERKRKAKAKDTAIHEVQDVLAEKGDLGYKEFLVQWRHWDPKDTQWIQASGNMGLVRWLDANRANPYSCTLNRRKLLGVDRHPNDEVVALRAAVWDALSTPTATPDGNVGVEMTSNISIPFSKESFDSVFRSLGCQDIPTMDSGNVECMVTHALMSQALGPGWDVRTFKTSTLNRVQDAGIHLKWGFHERYNWDHSQCNR